MVCQFSEGDHKCQFELLPNSMTNLATDTFCQYHLGENEKKNWDDRTIAQFYTELASYITAVSQGVITQNFNSREVVNLIGVVFPGSFVYDSVNPNANPKISPLLQYAKFLGDANFQNIRFKNPSDFSFTEFMGSANFYHTTFEGDITFQKAKFLDSCSFKKVNCEGEVDFLSTYFQGKSEFSKIKCNRDVNFHKSIFNDLAIFNDAKFIKNVYFSNVIFNQGVLFRNAIFEDTGIFDSAEFSCNSSPVGPEITTDFFNVTFRLGASFSSANFYGITLFSHSSFCNQSIIGRSMLTGVSFCLAKFYRSVKFIDVWFQESCNFDYAVFYGYADFSCETADSTNQRSSFGIASFAKTRFEMTVNFTNRYFHQPAIFRNTIFRKAPLFFGCTIHPGTDFNGSKFLDRGENGRPEVSRAYQALRVLMENNRARYEQSRFFSFEQQSLRNSNQLKGLTWLLSWLYELTTYYGRSVSRPFICFFWVTSFFFILYSFINSSVSKVDPKAVIVFTIEQITRPFGVWSTSYNPITDLKNSWDNFQFAYQIIATFQSLISLSLIALFLLVIRWRFKRE